MHLLVVQTERNLQGEGSLVKLYRYEDRKQTHEIAAYDPSIVNDEIKLSIEDFRQNGHSTQP